MALDKWVRSALTGVVTVLASANAQSVEIEDQLRAKYGRRLTFTTERARQVVYGFDIDCRFQDGRYLPLANLLLVRLSMMDDSKLWTVTSVDSRGGIVRVTDTATNQAGPIESQLIMEINEWNELRPIGISATAILNACSGYWGKIWRMPRQIRK